eukprot:CAMPEP_0114294992 /NCGR_PEP_ID=MMETSP0059-20121206/10429_1 /TAXON_ID=36894 /ORGANISM="Pyramimonas parkeae, Strain CCMP726" /LENGTH=208 /DNA_ID=CAMNT_0001416821 /DNA_START=77 /DNA_END=699 /DNA_ORIENTATION=+
MRWVSSALCAARSRSTSIGGSAPLNALNNMQVRPGGIFGIKTDPHIFIRWRELATRAFSASASSDPYDMLGVSRGANPDEIKKAYRREALKWHPDRHQGPEKAAAEERFKKITQAYQTLSEPGGRRAYDAGPSGGGARSGAEQAWQQAQWQRQQAGFRQHQYSREEADRVFRDMFGNADVLRQFEEMARRMRDARPGQPGAGGFSSMG